MPTASSWGIDAGYHLRVFYETMKIPLRNDFKGFERVSSSAYMGGRMLIYLVIVGAVAGGVYYLGPFEDPKLRNMVSGGTLFAMFVGVLIYQHLFARFTCKRCGCGMIKYRDPDSSGVTLYYACDRCRIYWKNRAVS